MKKIFMRIIPFRSRAWLYQTLILSALLLTVLAACGPAGDQGADGPPPVQDAAPEVVSPSSEEQVQAYPADDAYPPPPPTVAQVDESYPIETLPPPSPTPIPDVYPPPTVAEVFAEPRIQIDLPVSVSDTVITGQAPAGLSLAVIDVTYNGALLGQGDTGPDGRFAIDVGGLIEGNRLGLTFGELEPGLGIAEMSIKYYPDRGEGFMNIPNVGVILDSTLISP